MRIVRFTLDNQELYGVLKNNRVHILRTSPFLSVETGRPLEPSAGAHHLSEIKLLAPCLPSKLVCLGLNYRPHAQEVHLNLPVSPLIFIKPSTSVIGPEDAIVLPKNWHRVDFEGELGVVIAKKAKNVPENRALDYVLGYTCVNDVTERTVQKEDGQWTRAKGYDTFAPIGPWIETDLDTDNLKLETYLNGEVRQSARTSELIFGISKLISYISESMTLLPGDIISTGTPAGIGGMKPGDTVEVKIEGLGILKNRVIETPLPGQKG
jgi:2-keto-4-pentenoate hydratase/2-oxohepta-3-ene-1,7-dioic acid hydratase in catechol pathway